MDQVTIEELVINTFLLLRTKKKMRRAYKNWCDIFPGSGRRVYLKKKKNNPNQTKAKRVEELII